MFFHYNYVVRRIGPQTAQKATMDTAKKFKPETILLWEQVAEHSETQRILGLFPSAYAEKHPKFGASSKTAARRASATA